LYFQEEKEGMKEMREIMGFTICNSTRWGYFHKRIRQIFREGVSQVLSRFGDSQCCRSSLFYATFVWSCQPGKERNLYRTRDTICETSLSI